MQYEPFPDFSRKGSVKSNKTGKNSPRSGKNKKTFNKPGPGRPKGSKNKTSLLLKDAILMAAEGAGGKEGLVGYLKTQALENPGPFMTLLGKIIPTQTQVTGPTGGPVMIADISKLKGMTEAELDVLERALVQIGLAEGDPSGTGEPEE